jgi:hypothetical protein
LPPDERDKYPSKRIPPQSTKKLKQMVRQFPVARAAPKLRKP